MRKNDKISRWAWSKTLDSKGCVKAKSERVSYETIHMAQQSIIIGRKIRKWWGANWAELIRVYIWTRLEMHINRWLVVVNRERADNKLSMWWKIE